MENVCPDSYYQPASQDSFTRRQNSLLFFFIALTNQDLVCLTTVSCHCNKLGENYNAS